MTGTNNPSQDFHLHSSVDMVSSTPSIVGSESIHVNCDRLLRPKYVSSSVAELGKCLWLPFDNIVGV